MSDKLPAPRVAGEVARRPFNLDEAIRRLPKRVRRVIHKHPELLVRARLALAAIQVIAESGSFVRLILAILDDSQSIADLEAEGILCAGFEAFLDPFKAANLTNVLATVWLMNNHVPLLRTVSAPKAEPLTSYKAADGTPLNDAAIAGLIFQILLTMWYEARRGELVTVRSTTLICTDGLHSATGTPVTDVKILVDYLHQLQHQIIGVGVGSKWKFTRAFRRMGIYDQDIHVAGDFARLQPALETAGRQALESTLALPARKAIALPGAAAPADSAPKRRRPSWRPGSR